MRDHGTLCSRVRVALYAKPAACSTAMPHSSMAVRAPCLRTESWYPCDIASLVTSSQCFGSFHELLEIYRQIMDTGGMPADFQGVPVACMQLALEVKPHKLTLTLQQLEAWVNFFAGAPRRSGAIDSKKMTATPQRVGNLPWSMGRTCR